MASDLYQVLEITQDATSDEVRKAYKKLALKTHPDRQPQGVTAAQKQEATDKFRKVNNAYEVLNDPQKRAEYDRTGVWPPPEEQPTRPSRSRTYPDAHIFGGDWNHGPSSSRGQPHTATFTFTDPFVLFNSLFGDMEDQFNDPFFSGAPVFAPPFGGAPHDPFAGTPFASTPFVGPRFPGRGATMNSFFGPGPSNFDEALAQLHGGDMGGFGSSSSRTFASSSTGRGAQSWSKSVVTRTVNGRTETVVTERDPNGNEHVTYTSPEGQRRTINGVEQPARGVTLGSQGRLPAPASHRSSIESRESRSTRDSRVAPVAPSVRSERDSATSSRHDHRGTAREYYDQQPNFRTSRSSHSHHHDSAPVIPYEIPRSSGDRRTPRRSETDHPREEEDHRYRRSHTVSSTRQETGVYGQPFDGTQESSTHHKRWWPWQG